MKHFIECVLKENEEIQKILSTPANMIYTQQDKQDFINATHCDLCEKPLGADRVRDHCHLKVSLGPPFIIAAISYINYPRKSPSYSTMEKITTPI